MRHDDKEPTHDFKRDWRLHGDEKPGSKYRMDESNQAPERKAHRFETEDTYQETFEECSPHPPLRFLLEVCLSVQTICIRQSCWWHTVCISAKILGMVLDRTSLEQHVNGPFGPSGTHLLD